MIVQFIDVYRNIEQFVVIRNVEQCPIDPESAGELIEWHRKMLGIINVMLMEVVRQHMPEAAKEAEKQIRDLAEANPAGNA